MLELNHGALVARRWGRLLCVGVVSCTLVACATTMESRDPPNQCSRGSARPANPNGSVLLPSAAAGQQNSNVMVFDRDGQASTGTTAPDTAVPAIRSNEDEAGTGQDFSSAKRTPSRSRRAISMGPSAPLKTQVRDC